MKSAFIFHGTGGYPEENWFPWLKQELDSLGYDVHVPQFPTPENQTLEAWFEVLKPYEKEINGETIMVGHSLGGAFLLRVLETIRAKIQTACFIGTPIGVLPIKNYDGDRLFISKPFDWGKIKAAAKHFIVYQSDDDPYVCLGNGEKLAKELGVELSFVLNAGHFNKTAGYTRFPQLLEAIKALIQA